MILQAGSFTKDTLAEDADLTPKILRAGHRIEYEEQAIALTEAPVMDLLLVGSLVAYGWQRNQHPNDLAANDALTRVLIFYVLFLVIDFLGALVAFLLEHKEQWSLLFWLFFQRFVYRQLMYYVAIQSVATAIRGRISGWGKLERKATVKA